MTDSDDRGIDREQYQIADDERQAEREDQGDLTETQQVRHDERYSPASERETEVTQSEDPGADLPGVVSRPGIGGADDAGDVNVDDEAIRERIAERGADPGDRPVG